MLNPRDTNPPSTVNANNRDRNAQPDLGDADAVDKTTYVGHAHSTDTAESAAHSAPVTAAVRTNGGMGLLGKVTLILAVLVLLAYGVALFG
jgi:hypothetical protein